MGLFVDPMSLIGLAASAGHIVGAASSSPSASPSSSASPSPSASASPSASPSESATAIPTVGDAVDWAGSFFTSGAPLQIAGIIVGAILLSWGLSFLIRRIVRRTIEKSTHDRGGTGPSLLVMKERREQRASAIGQLVRSVLALSIWSMAILMILSLVGLNIAPLIASASVIGVALGFGAQTLVKDYISGIFLIIEDQFGVGDVVDLGDAVGTVEEVTLRVTRLRDLTGVVWYVRNGEILRVANRSQGWTLAVIDIPVAYDEDLDRVRGIVESTADAMVDDSEDPLPEFNRPEYAGIESVSGEAVYIRVVAKAAPDDQVSLTRQVRERLKQAFDAAGVKVPIVFRMPGGTGGGTSGSGGSGSGGKAK